jgi:glycosyltransferase involved in cell wall biosynthesis
MEYETGSYEFAEPSNSPWCVMVLAYNEERHIEACLDSIFQGEPSRAIDVYVMANGCTDRTEHVVRDYRRKRPSVHLVSIALGDKCNAWNVFIHETVQKCCSGKDIYFFMDGDARIVPGSLTALELGLSGNPRAHAASAPPASGRSMENDRQELLNGHHLVANLYAIRGDFVRRLQAEGVRLPLKLEGDDGLLGILIKWDLQPEAGKTDDSRIQPCASAGFTFTSVDRRNWGEWRGYWRRLVRYGRRRFEFQLLGPRLKRQGMSAMPVDISEIYGDASSLRLRWEGLQTVPNWFALREMRSQGRSLSLRPTNPL